MLPRAEDREEGKTAMIAGISIAGAVAILGLAGGGFYYAKRYASLEDEFLERFSFISERCHRPCLCAVL